MRFVRWPSIKGLLTGPRLYVLNSLLLACRSYRQTVPILVAAYFTLACVSIVHAQAWPKPQGGYYTKLAFGTTAATEQYGANGNRKPYNESVSSNDFLDQSFYFYAEYGLTHRITIVTLIPFKRLTVRDTGSEMNASGFGTLGIGLRYGLMTPERVQTTGRSSSFLFSLNLPTGYARNRTPSVGTGQVDAQLGLSVGQSLYPFPGYVQASLSYRMRTDIYLLSKTIDCLEPQNFDCFTDQKADYGDEWIFLAEIGATVRERVLLQALAHGIWSNVQPEVEFDPLNPLPTHQRLLKLGGGAIVYLGHGLGIGIQVFTTPIGRNTIRSVDWFFSVEYAN